MAKGARREAGRVAACGLILLLTLLGSSPSVQAARALPRSEKVPGRGLQQASCSASNVYFVQDAACQFNVGSGNNIGLWTTVIKHTCPDALTGLTLEVSLGYAPNALGSISGVEGCSFLPGQGTSAVCQLSQRTIYQGPYQNTDSTTIELGSLPLSQGAQYSIWYLSTDHPCGSTNLAPYYFNVVSATFAGEPAPSTATPVATRPAVATPVPTPPAVLSSAAPKASVAPTATPVAQAPTAAVNSPTPGPTIIDSGIPYRAFPNTTINLSAQIPPEQPFFNRCGNGGFPYFDTNGLGCFLQACFNSGTGAVAASFQTQTGCCFCYHTATVADLGVEGGAPGVNSFILAL